MRQLTLHKHRLPGNSMRLGGWPPGKKGWVIATLGDTMATLILAGLLGAGLLALDLLTAPRYGEPSV